MKKKRTIWQRLIKACQIFLVFPGALVAVIVYGIAMSFRSFILKKPVGQYGAVLSAILMRGMNIAAGIIWALLILLIIHRFF